MSRNESAALRASHDVATYRLLNRIEYLAGNPCGENTASNAALRRERAELAEHFADYQLYADDADVDLPPRDWIRHAILEADADALPALVRLIRLEIANERDASA